ncbi:MAG: helix-turn-helix transcriptional regulator [Anaerolineaceae bacterium]|nr:helix-turn-helix transcriptional regulator [Anaerolineaceae bacterium]
MYHIKNDQRALRSCDLIYEGLAALLAQKPFEAIKVNELADQAQVGRATFYRNFDLIEDVLRWRCDQVLDALFASLASGVYVPQPGERMPFLQPVLRYFSNHSQLIELLIQARRTDLLELAFYQRLARLKPQMMALIDAPEVYLEYGLVIRSSVVVNVLIHWVRTGKQDAPDLLAAGLNEVASQMRAHNLLL